MGGHCSSVAVDSGESRMLPIQCYYYKDTLCRYDADTDAYACTSVL